MEGLDPEAEQGEYENNIPESLESNENTNGADDCAESDDPYAFGAHVRMKDVKEIPISIEKFWSGFDDFLELQKILNHHDNTERVPDTPENDVGAQIVFDYLGGKTYER